MSTDELLGCAETDGSVLMDISGLTDEQRKTVLQMVEAYCRFNEISRALSKDDR